MEDLILLDTTELLRVMPRKLLESHPNPVDLVERTRRRFPSPTITTDRAHPSYPHAA